MYSYHIWRAWYNGSYTMMAKPIRALGLHYPMMQFFIRYIVRLRFPCTKSNPYPLTRMLFFFPASHTASNLWRLSDIEQFMFFLQAKTKDSQCIKHSGIRTLKNIVLLSRQIKLVVMLGSNATLKAFQLDQGKSNNIFPVLLLQKKKKRRRRKMQGWHIEQLDG